MLDEIGHHLTQPQDSIFGGIFFFPFFFQFWLFLLIRSVSTDSKISKLNRCLVECFDCLKYFRFFLQNFSLLPFCLLFSPFFKQTKFCFVHFFSCNSFLFGLCNKTANKTMKLMIFAWSWPLTRLSISLFFSFFFVIIFGLFDVLPIGFRFPVTHTFIHRLPFGSWSTWITECLHG